MTKTKRIFSGLIAVMVLVTTMIATVIPTSAASVSSSIGYNQPENSGDYAYWNGSRVVKSKSTSKDEIKWMQAALNRCISHEGLNAKKLSVDGSFGPATKATTIKFQKAAGLTQDGSFGPSTIKKMKNILNDGKVSFKPSTNYNRTTSKNTSNENGVIYTYVTVSVDTSTMANWVASMQANSKYASSLGEGAIVAATVKDTKTVTWHVPKAAVYSGPGYTGTVKVKYTVPSKIQYQLHTHKRNIGFGSSMYYSGGNIVTVYTCNCGYRKELNSWTIPLPDFTKYSDTQTTQKVIQGLPQINK